MRPRQVVEEVPLPIRRQQALVPRFVPSASYAGVESPSQKVVDSAPASGVESSRQASAAAILQPAPNVGQPRFTEEKKVMQLALKGLSKNGRTAFYTGASQVVRIQVGTFTDPKNPPTTIDVQDGVLAGPKQPKARMTAEERKAARATQPPLTEAERIAKAEANLAKRKAKLAAAQGAPAV